MAQQLLPLDKEQASAGKAVGSEAEQQVPASGTPKSCQDLQPVCFWELQAGRELSRLLKKNQGCTRLNFSQSYPKIHVSFLFLFKIVLWLQAANMLACFAPVYTEAQKTQLTTADKDFLTFCNVK